MSGRYGTSAPSQTAIIGVRHARSRQVPLRAYRVRSRSQSRGRLGLSLHRLPDADRIGLSSLSAHPKRKVSLVDRTAEDVHQASGQRCKASALVLWRLRNARLFICRRKPSHLLAARGLPAAAGRTATAKATLVSIGASVVGESGSRYEAGSSMNAARAVRRRVEYDR